MRLWWMAMWLWGYGVLKTNAQYYFYNDRYYAGSLVLEGGSSGGIMNSLTDLGGRKGNGVGLLKDLNWSVSRPSYGLFLSGTYKEVIGLRIEFTSGNISAHDSLIKSGQADLSQRYGRNLGFRSIITELQFAAEIHPLQLRRSPESKATYWSPFIVAGIGYFKFNPQANLNGNWYDLQPLYLEGQGFPEYSDRKPYGLKQINVPIGLGIKYELGACLNTRLEIIHRILFTDYLDDVSSGYIDPDLFFKYLSADQAVIAQQLYCRIKGLPPGTTIQEGSVRGDPKHNDTFFTIQLKISWAFRERIK
jgi:hypothetical protein